ncbi:Cof-type HAD-IIB family hydrolase [Pseudomonas piscis]|uniref:Cof-type HAD-IIB family hydrolase n=1 Tax=Pseudomonas piscis TaxID=2614538 RepID=UPI00384BAA66
MYDLIASDLDGTLLLPGDRIGDYTCNTLWQLHQAGRQIVLATGRHQRDVRSLIGKRLPPVHLITANGASIASACGNLRLVQELDNELVRELIASATDRQWVINAYCQAQWLISDHYPNLDNFSQNPAFQPTLCAPADFLEQGVQKLFFFHHDQDHAALARLQSHLDACFGARISSVFSFPWCLEVMAGGVSKGHALQRLAQLLGVALKRCVAFGDGMNDVSMLAKAGQAVMMDSVHHDVRRALPEAAMIGHCGEEAVARYLATLLPA